MIVVGVVSPLAVTRLGLHGVVVGEPTWRVGSSTSTVEEFVQAIESHSCAVVLVDASDRGASAIEPLVARGFAVVTWGADPETAADWGASRAVGLEASPAEVRAALIDAFAERPGADSFCVSQLTTRQLEVLVRVGGGLANKQIARDLDISLSTVKRHMEQLMHRTGRRNRAELATLAADLGELRPETLNVLNRGDVTSTGS